MVSSSPALGGPGVNEGVLFSGIKEQILIYRIPLCHRHTVIALIVA